MTPAQIDVIVGRLGDDWGKAGEFTFTRWADEETGAVISGTFDKGKLAGKKYQETLSP